MERVLRRVGIKRVGEHPACIVKQYAGWGGWGRGAYVGVAWLDEENVSRLQ